MLVATLSELRSRLRFLYTLAKAALQCSFGLEVNALQTAKLTLATTQDRVVLQTGHLSICLPAWIARELSVDLMHAANHIDPNGARGKPLIRPDTFPIGLPGFELQRDVQDDEPRGFGHALPPEQPRVIANCQICNAEINSEDPYHVEKGNFFTCADCGGQLVG